jgi:PII-like signaling protein
MTPGAPAAGQVQAAEQTRQLAEDAELLRIYIGERDRYLGRPLCEALVEAANSRGLAGATVIKGVLGFGARRRIHTAKILRLSADLPVIVEIVDLTARIEAFLPVVAAMVEGGTITVSKVRAVLHPPVRIRT